MGFVYEIKGNLSEEEESVIDLICYYRDLLRNLGKKKNSPKLLKKRNL